MQIQRCLKWRVEMSEMDANSILKVAISRTSLDNTSLISWQVPTTQLKYMLLVYAGRLFPWPILRFTSMCINRFACSRAETSSIGRTTRGLADHIGEHCAVSSQHGVRATHGQETISLNGSGCHWYMWRNVYRLIVPWPTTSLTARHLMLGHTFACVCVCVCTSAIWL